MSVEFPPDGYEVYHWPEFQQFAKRLGIHWEAPTTRITIIIPVDGIVQIAHEYNGRNCDHKLAATRPAETA